MRAIGATLFVTTALLSSADAVASAQAQSRSEEPFLFDSNALGTVELPVSCNDVASERMEHGLALLHHMMYTEADLVFQSVVEADASCAMGYWGRAMTLIHPMWPDVPRAEELEQGTELVERARATGPGSAREKAYIDAVGGYFHDGGRRTEGERVSSFHDGWQNAHERFPEDWEATSFYALARLALGELGLTDSSKVAMSAAAEMQTLLARVPDHPAAHHYAIHAYDYLRLDTWAPEVARSYGGLAPEVPHALHMPTHIFTSLGLWSESIALNERSAAAAWKQGRRSMGLDNHYPHALSYLIYAYLQTGQDAPARQILERAISVEGPFSKLNRMVFAAHLAGIPVRYALERHAWEEAAQLKIRAASAFPWDEYPQFDAVTYYGRTIGSARLDDAPAARAAVAALRSSLELAGPQGTSSWLIWDDQTLLMVAEAWVDYANEDVEGAILKMRNAAERSESATELGPGQLLPAAEQLADMYLELGRFQEALTTYEDVLSTLPNRFNSHCGAAHAAELLGDAERARSHRAALDAMLSDDESARDCASGEEASDER